MSRIVLCGALFLASLTLSPPASAVCCPSIGKCNPSQCSQSVAIIMRYHEQGEPPMIDHMTRRMSWHKERLTRLKPELSKQPTEITLHQGEIPEYENDPTWPEVFIPALAGIVEHTSALAHHHAQSIGRLFDAKNQLETQRELETMKFEAYKKYQPSETFCWFGTNTRHLHSAEAKSGYNQEAFNAKAMQTALGAQKTAGAGSKREDFLSRWKMFADNYCRTSDNNNGLNHACGSTKPWPNEDLKYTKYINSPRTLNVDFTDTSTSAKEQDLVSLGRNLYGHRPLSRNLVYTSKEDAQTNYISLRSIQAKRNVAESSFGSLISLKAKGENASAKDFLKELVATIGGDVDDIGDNPSYYAQLEVMAKRIYQNPHFYANLYDSPESIARKSAALQAIELMLDRAIAESENRQEMMMSVLLTSNMRGAIVEAESGNVGSTKSGDD